MSGKKWVRRTELHERSHWREERTEIRVDTSGFQDAIKHCLERFQINPEAVREAAQRLWEQESGRAWGAMPRYERGALRDSMVGFPLFSGNPFEQINTNVASAELPASPWGLPITVDPAVEPGTVEIRSAAIPWLSAIPSSEIPRRVVTSDDISNAMRAAFALSVGLIPHSFTRAPNENHPSGDAMSMRYDLEATSTCWKKVGKIETCGEPADPESETGVCSMHLQEYKR